MRELTYKQSLNEALFQAMEQDSSVFVMGEDVGIYGGGFGVLSGLFSRFGEKRVINTPISENGFCGMAIGCATMGMKPVVELMFADFLSLAFDAIVNTGAKLKYTYNKDVKKCVIFRGAVGCGTGASAQHSQSVESWFMGVPGVKIISPSTPYDAKGLLLSSLNDNNIIIFLEPKTLYNKKGHVPEEMYTLPIGKASLVHQGKDISIITYGRMTDVALAACDTLKNENIFCDVLDLRTIKPLDVDAILETAKKTGRVIVLSDAPKIGSVTGEISSIISESDVFFSLKAPIQRLCAKDTPVPCSIELENSYILSVDEICSAARNLINNKK
ncbi:MAG: alpha-ketoacid dehydrogenase subunit beta [Oscillospiraceae bacterium]